MPADEVLPWVRERFRRRPHVSLHVLGEIADVNRRPARVDDVDEHQRVVVRQVDIDVVRRMIAPQPRELDALSADLERATVLEDFLRRRPCRIVVTYQEAPRLLVADASDALVEERRRAGVVCVVMRVHEVCDLAAHAVLGGNLVHRALDVATDRWRRVEQHDAIARSQAVTCLLRCISGVDYNNRSVRKAPIALSACRAALKLSTLATNPCGIPIHTSSAASTPPVTTRAT